MTLRNRFLSLLRATNEINLRFFFFFFFRVNTHLTGDKCHATIRCAGDYECLAENREGSISAWTKLLIAGPAVITQPPTNLTKLEGDRAEFACEAKALPSNVTHKWFFNGQPISQLSSASSRVQVKQDGTLSLHPTTSDDTGLYTCEVWNGIGSPETQSAYLDVQFPARVVFSPNVQYLPLGLSGLVRCFVRANPPVSRVTWTKDHLPFEPSSMPGVVDLNNGSLLFQTVGLEHQGVYRCNPYNLHGNAASDISMQVLVRGKI